MVTRAPRAADVARGHATPRLEARRALSRSRSVPIVTLLVAAAFLYVAGGARRLLVVEAYRNARAGVTIACPRQARKRRSATFVDRCRVAPRLGRGRPGAFI
jgi:hypothetical protein